MSKHTIKPFCAYIHKYTNEGNIQISEEKWTTQKLHEDHWTFPLG